MTGTPEVGQRIATLDAVRGFAVCGILLMNIVSMGMPGYAYVDPTYYGNEGPADLVAWAFNYIFSDGKMRGLFTMLFGASMVLIAERAAANGEPPLETHYRRMWWLFVFGMVHGWLIWYGDILVQYALAGALGFFLWRLAPGRLWAFALAMFALQILLYASDHVHLSGLKAAAEAPGASAAAVTAWSAQLPTANYVAKEIELYGAGLAEAFEARMPMTLYFQMILLPKSVPETLGFMALGILLYRNGFLTGAWARGRYWRTAALGYLLAAPLYAPLVWLLLGQDFDPALIPLTDAGSFLLRPFVALAHAAMIILLLQSGFARWLSERLEAAGRMAFSNYLGTSLVTTSFFYGYGFGRFGTLSRAELYLVVIAVWALILIWSKPWLDRYRYGPLEWLWRTLARGELQPMRRALPA